MCVFVRILPGNLKRIFPHLGILFTFALRFCKKRTSAQMAKLVDALVSGTSDRKVVQVRVLFWAPKKSSCNSCSFFYSGQSLGIFTLEFVEIYFLPECSIIFATFCRPSHACINFVSGGPMYSMVPPP